MRILVINGPNLNGLGTREPQHYGVLTLAEIERRIAVRAGELGVEARFFQSNHEGALIDQIQATEDVDGIIINGAGLTHTSVTLRDALVAAGKPTVEVHLSNIYAREPFRHNSLIAPVVLGQISGLREHGYLAALDAMVAILKEGTK